MFDPRAKLREEMLAAPDAVDELNLPPHFLASRDILREAITRMELTGIPNGTIAGVMLAEMLPRMAYEHGPEWLATMLAKLAANVREGLRPD